MKYFTTLLALLLSYSMLGQFIPQPMGYNPDANGDSFIGVDDLTGMLALYGNAFQNDDTLNIKTIEFPEEYDLYPLNQFLGYTISEDWDILYLNQKEDEGVSLYLPSGTGYKVVQVFVSCENFAQMPIWFLPPNGTPTIFGGSMNVICGSPRVFTFIRGHNGKWYSQDTDNN